MSEEAFVSHAAPTLAGIKTANLFTIENDNHDLIMDGIRKLNQLLTSRGIRVIPLKENEKRVLIYVYRPSRLWQDFQNKELLELLGDLEYPTSNPDQCVVKLIKKLKESERFPHEIGLFLGYPPEDVKGFIQNEARNYKCTGLWRVYGDVLEAKKKFDRYKKCTDDYCMRMHNGTSLDELVVAM